MNIVRFMDKFNFPYYYAHSDSGKQNMMHPTIYYMITTIQIPIFNKEDANGYTEVYAWGTDRFG